MRRAGLWVVLVAFVAAFGVTLWLVREMRQAVATSGAVAVPINTPGGTTAPPALAPAGAADHLPASAQATPGAPGAIEGLVTGADGKALAGVRVQLASRGDGKAGLAPVEARTGFDGRFAFGGVEPGRAVVVAAQDGVALGTSRAVQVLAGPPARLELSLPEAGLLEGTVGGESPAAVVVVPLHLGPGPGQVARATVDRGGAYRISLPAGQYRVHAAPAAAARADLRVTPAFTAVAAGKTTRLDLRALPATREEGVTVRVLEPGGAPAAGAAVTVSRAGDERVAFASAAGEDGTLVLAREMGMAGQAVTLRARAGGRTGAFTGPLPAEGELRLPLQSGGTVEGDVKGGAPVAGFALTVEAAPTPGLWRAVESLRLTGDRFVLGDLPPEPVRLTVRTDDGRAGSAEVTLSPGQVVRLTVALHPAVTPAVTPASR
jgi:hypothetical protein